MAEGLELSTVSDKAWTTFAGVGGLVTHDSKLLMIRQRRPYGVHWELPSGYYEPSESFEQGTAREVLASRLPRPQLEEGIEEARYVDPLELESEIHPLYVPILERWWGQGATGFHVYAEVSVRQDGTQSYVFRDSNAS